MPFPVDTSRFPSGSSLSPPGAQIPAWSAGSLNVRLVWSVVETDTTTPW